MTENIIVFIQNSIRIAGSKGVIYIDPFKIDSEPHDADIIFVTHDHYDHFSPEDIAKVAQDETILVVPEKMEKKAGEVKKYVKQIVCVKQIQKGSINGLDFEPFHPKHAGWVGYILEVDGSRIYVAGDTDATKEAKAVSCDIALIPIGGTYTMDAEKASELINVIKPKVAIPTHYGSIVGSKKDADVFASAVSPEVKVEIKI